MNMKQKLFYLKEYGGILPPDWVIPIGEKEFKQWSEAIEEEMSIRYGYYHPDHPNCRCVLIPMLEEYKDAFNPRCYLYEKFNESSPQRPKSKARNRLEWFAIIIGGLVCGWILYVQRGGMR